ncbi:uncharacterized protein NDAI_0B04480 [Naumovozyma dairenensis CBS 421]|uniref:PH domain-containing protein n=1 Tax=Naumovozyma dairenensis (strain ATCC 10597 / BCRC 20456 / CBS 421 / NBRC 0211 / NRRL Y-12639) TaxID=1071378 RepID=G0W6S2_NAUDC|nr:hypothetical protein NDAI_0B04480 [Naumovozyma dairenensis CBS 421]CCD23483.1 hypothetical protein NDAI_0B04480 [Naumovozyma dairenensis CBS 421]
MRYPTTFVSPFFVTITSKMSLFLPIQEGITQSTASDTINIERLKSPTSSSSISEIESESQQDQDQEEEEREDGDSVTVSSSNKTASIFNPIVVNSPLPGSNNKKKNMFLSKFSNCNNKNNNTTQQARIKGENSTTKLTTTSLSSEQKVIFADENNDFLKYLDLKPVKPPKYNEMNPNKMIRFPIYEHTIPCNINDLPPNYTPTVDQITLISLKLEWNSPYDISNSRNWKNFIMEINSTQLNFYHIDPSLTNHIRHYYNGYSSSNGSHSFSLTKTNSLYQFTKTDQEQIIFNIKRDKLKYLSSNTLYKSYTLQFATFGIPVDYKKKCFVLRLRCETQQFLINFSHVDDMIDWTVHLNTGISVALDLDARQLPDYRIVPRRRRRRRHRRCRHHRHGHKHSHRTNNSRQYSSSNDNNNAMPTYKTLIPDLLNLSITDDFTNSMRNYGTVQQTNVSNNNNDIVGRNRSASLNAYTSQRSQLNLKSKIRNFFRSSSSSRFNSKIRTTLPLSCVREEEIVQEYTTNTTITATTRTTRTTTTTSRLRSHTMNIETSNSNSETLPSKSCENMLRMHDMSFQRELDEFRQVIEEHNESNHDDYDEEEEEEEDDDDDDDDEPPNIYEDEEDNDDDRALHEPSNENPIYNNEEIYPSDGEYEDEDDNYEYTSTMQSNSSFRQRAASTASCLSNIPYGSNDIKWAPFPKQMSRRRYIRDSIRCIKPLLEDSEWVGNVVLRPITPPKFKTNNQMLSSLQHNNNNNNNNPCSGTRNDLNKVKNHYLKSYIVGPAGFLKADPKTPHT